MAAVQNEFELEVPSCPVCQEEYGGGKTPIPMILQCGHSVCNNCIVGLKSVSGVGALSCPTCRAASNNLVNPPKNFKLEEAVSIIRKLKEKPAGPEIPVKCSNCLKMDEEADMYMCRNCVKEVHNHDIRGSVNPQAQLDIQSMAICGSCAIKNHVAVGHETSSYFDISSGFQFTSQLTSVNLLRDELEQQVSKVAEWSTHFRQSAGSFFNELDKMTDMMRKSKSSTIQQNFAKSIENEIEQLSTHAQSVVDSMRTGETVFSKRLGELIARNKVDEATKCREIKSIGTEKKCCECLTEKIDEKMYCCQHCSEVVSKLMSGTMETEELNEVDINQMLICTNCLVDNHFGGEHKPVKYQEVEKSCESIVRRSRVEKKEKAVKSRFAGLIETFSNYTEFLQDYEERISKMSKIMSECKDDDIVRDFEKSIDEAEHAIQSLQINTQKNTNGEGIKPSSKKS